MKWQPIETAPKDGAVFLCLIDGLPYAARFDELGRFVWYWHTDMGEGPNYRIHNVDGKQMLEETLQHKPDYQPSGHLWVAGFDEKRRTHWMPLPEPPND